MQSAHYLLKSRANSLTFQKYWEVGLKGRMIPASSIPLVERHRPARKGLRLFTAFSNIVSNFMSKDIVLLERD